MYNAWAQNIAITLEVIIGTLTTALGASLSGHNVRGIKAFTSP